VLATWSDAGRARLKESLYAEASLGNPVDVVATAGPDHYFAAVDTLLKEDGVDMVMVNLITAPFVDLDGIAVRIKEAASASSKPVVSVVMTIEKWAGLVRKLRESGIPVYDFPEDAARSLAHMARYDELRRRPVEGPPALDVDREAAAAIVRCHEGRDAFIPQADAFALLGAYRIGVARTVAIASRGDLGRADMAFPAVLKVDSAAVIHKSEQGGVILGIRDAAALAAAYDSLQGRFGGPGVRCVLQAQHPSGREVIIGQAVCPGLGALVMFGLGGLFVEVLRDVSFGVAPLSRREAGELMREIRGARILEGLRGEPAIDAEALEMMLCRVARLAADFPAIVEMDLNPVLAYPAGQAPVAVDARIRIR